MTNANGYVTWKNLLSVVTIAVTVAIAFDTAMWLMHGQAQVQFEKRMDAQFANMREQLTEIKTRLPR